MVIYSWNGKRNKNIVVDIELSTFKSEFFFYNDNDDDDEYETKLHLNTKENWSSLNKLIENYI